MSWKNRLIKAILWILSPTTTRRKPPLKEGRILVVSTTGLGDTLWGTPALRAIRQTFPECHLAVLTSPIGEQVLAHNKHIDELFVLSDSTFFSLLRFFPSLKKRGFDTILLFHTSQRLVLPACALLEPTHLIGTAGLQKGLDSLLTRALPNTPQHEIERRLAMAKAIGAHISDYSLHMPVRKEDSDAAEQFLESHGVPSHLPLVGLHPGAKNTFKQWPKGHFQELGRRLIDHLGCQIFVTGDASEGLLLLEIASEIPGAIPIAGELPLSTFTALIKRMTLFVTNDTGPMHLAFSTQTPTLALFGPTDPKLCGPLHHKHAHILKTRPTCAPCLKKKCAEPFCMMQIGPDAVYNAAIDAVYSSTPKILC